MGLATNLLKNYGLPLAAEAAAGALFDSEDRGRGAIDGVVSGALTLGGLNAARRFTNAGSMIGKVPIGKYLHDPDLNQVLPYLATPIMQGLTQGIHGWISPSPNLTA